MSLKAVEIIETSPIKKGDYKILLGFAGAGFIGNNATMYAIRSKGFKQVAHLKSNHIPPMTLIVNGNPMQSFRVYLDENDGIIFVVTESLIPNEGCRPIARELLEWLKLKGAKEIYSIEGLQSVSIFKQDRSNEVGLPFSQGGGPVRRHFLYHGSVSRRRVPICLLFRAYD